MTLQNSKPSSLTETTSKTHLGFSSTADQLISLLDFKYSHPKRLLFYLLCFQNEAAFFTISPTSAEEKFPSITFLCVLALCWTHYWLLERALFQPQRLYSSSRPPLCPPQRSISENEIILTLLDYIFLCFGVEFEVSLLPIREAYLLLTAKLLPNYSNYCCWWNGGAMRGLVIWPVILNESPQKEGQLCCAMLYL